MLKIFHYLLVVSIQQRQYQIVFKNITDFEEIISIPKVKTRTKYTK